VSERPALDILAIAAHRDDVEQTCGGVLLKSAERGQKTGILDLSQGEMGTRGTAEDRGRESMDAARILKVSWRGALDIPDGRVENTWENRLRIVRVLREQKPRVVILPYWKGRHPDHYNCSTLGYEACFLSGLTKLGKTHGWTEPEDLDTVAKLPPHRPFKIVYASLYYDIRPSFVVDISDEFERKVESLLAYKSQYDDQSTGSGLFPMRDEVRKRLETMAAFYGLLGGVKYAEPFVQKEVRVEDDLTAIPVKSL
jgi:N-acetylglucosamine malate deacetylase 1